MLHANHRSFVLICVIISLLPALVAFPGCSRTPINEKESQEEPEQPAGPRTGSVRVNVIQSARSTTIVRTDLFVYSLSDQKGLEFHGRFDDSSNVHTIDLQEGEKEIITIVNSPYRFNDQALGKMESLEQVQFKFEDDNPLTPAMSGRGSLTVEPDSEAGIEIGVTPLLCRITLSEASNNLSNYQRLENPRIFLRNLNPKAEILRENGFRPSENIEEGQRCPLPCDVGFYTQRPGTVLYCYPNETPENMLGSPRTELVLECEIRDTTRQFTVELPALGRAGVKSVAITVDEAHEYHYNVY